MIQTGLPQGPDSISVPLPDAFERWRDLYLHGGLQKVLVFLAVALVLYAVVRIARRALGDHIEDVNRRHIVRKWIGYAYFALLVAFAIAIFADFLTGLGTVLAVLLAGVAIALQDVLKSVVGWLYLSSRSGIEVGTRVEVSGRTGDVIDIGVLKTTMLEVGNMVYGRQASGRLVTIPNYQMLSEATVVSGGVNPFVWQEVRVTVTFESDWRRTEEILKMAGEELHAEIAPELEQGFRSLERRYAFKYGTRTPIVYVTIGDSGVHLTLRYMVNVRRRRGSEDRVSRLVLDRIVAEPSVELAYPTYRIYRDGEGRRGGPKSPPIESVPHLQEGGEEGGPPPEMMAE
jgi:small-conductance mechanosensitive channel